MTAARPFVVENAVCPRCSSALVYHPASGNLRCVGPRCEGTRATFAAVLAAKPPREGR